MRSKWFAVGMGIAAGAWLLHVAALALAPLSIVQAVMSTGVIVAAVLGNRLFGCEVPGRQWLGLGMTAAGLVALVATLPSPDGNVRALGSVVQPLALKMAPAVQPQITRRRTISRILVCDPGDWNGALFPEELAHQLAALSRLACTRYLGHFTLGIDGAPEIHHLATDPDEHLVEVPAPVWDRARRRRAISGPNVVTYRRIVS